MSNKVFLYTQKKFYLTKLVAKYKVWYDISSLEAKTPVSSVASVVFPDVYDTLFSDSYSGLYPLQYCLTGPLDL